MSLSVNKTASEQVVPVFLKILEDIPGGITIKTANIPSDVTQLKAGTLVTESSSTSGLYNLVKNAKSTSTQVSNVSITVKRPHLFKTGEFIGKYAGHTASTITTITHTAATTDTIVTTTAVGALATTTRLINCTVACRGAGTDVTLKYSPGAILKETVAVRNSDLSTLKNVTGAAIAQGSVIEANLPYYVTDTDKTTLKHFRFA